LCPFFSLSGEVARQRYLIIGVVYNEDAPYIGLLKENR
jgi:hypothetical protein